MESKNTKFFAVPYALIYSSEYSDMPVEAAVLYGLLRDRNKLSEKNKWTDEVGTFLYFTVSTVCEALGVTEVPCEVIECSRDEAVILAVDSNAQRQKLLPSERAFAYKMKLQALNSQGKRTDLDSCQSGTKLNSGYNLAAESGESRRKIYRLIRLTELIPELRDAVDTGRIALSAGVELSYLPVETQEQIEWLHGNGLPYPTYSQANQLKKMAAFCELSEDDIECVLRTPAPKKYLVIPAQRFGDMFRGYSNAEVEDVVERALKIYKRYLQSQRGCR